MKVSVRYEDLWQPKSFTSKKLGISFEEVDTTNENAEATIKQLVGRAKALIEFEKGEKK